MRYAILLSLLILAACNTVTGAVEDTTDVVGAVVP